MEQYLMEVRNIKQAGVPADLNANALTGARVSLKEANRVAVVISCGDSTGAAFAVSFQQHDAATSGNSKALSIANHYYHKAGTATSFTKVSPSSASSFDLATQFAAQEGIVVFEILAEDLDRANDYAWISCDIADTTAAKVVSVEYVLLEERKPAYAIVR